FRLGRLDLLVRRGERGDGLASLGAALGVAVLLEQRDRRGALVRVQAAQRLEQHGLLVFQHLLAEVFLLLVALVDRLLPLFAGRLLPRRGPAPPAAAGQVEIGAARAARLVRQPRRRRRRPVQRAHLVVERLVHVRQLGVEILELLDLCRRELELLGVL